MKTKQMTVAEYRVILANLESLRQSIDSLKAKPSKAGEGWLDNDDVAKILRVSKRQLQNYRDGGILPYSQFGNKIYYRGEDIETHLMNNYKKH